MQSAESLDEFERRAMAGMWATTLDLDDGVQHMTCHLGEDGQVSSTMQNHSPKPWHRWEAKVVNGEKVLKFKLYLGDLALEGKGVREGNSLRCASVSGSVIEGIDDPVYVGDFRMELAMPAADASEEKALRKSHKAKVDARPAPPPKYAVSAFFGRWRLLVALETTRASPTVDLHSIEFTADRKFRSVPGAATARGVLAGRWGVYDKTLSRKLNQAPSPNQRGTHMWMRVDREMCSGLELRESFSMWGKPTLNSPMAELAARSEEGSLTADTVDGAVFYGASMDKEWAMEGRFSLVKEDDLDDADQGQDEAGAGGGDGLDRPPLDAGEPSW